MSQTQGVNDPASASNVFCVIMIAVRFNLAQHSHPSTPPVIPPKLPFLPLLSPLVHFTSPTDCHTPSPLHRRAHSSVRSPSPSISGTSPATRSQYHDCLSATAPLWPTRRWPVATDLTRALRRLRVSLRWRDDHEKGNKGTHANLPSRQRQGQSSP